MVSMISRSTPAVFQGANLLGKGGAGFVEAGFAQRLETHAERAHGTADPGLAGLLIFKVFHGLAGNAHAGRVDLGHLPGQAMARQPEAIGAKGVGLKQSRRRPAGTPRGWRGSVPDRRGSTRRSSG